MGEEFVIILLNTTLEAAVTIAKISIRSSTHRVSRIKILDETKYNQEHR